MRFVAPEQDFTMLVDNAMSPAEVTVHTSDLLVATPDAADPLVDGAVLKALQILRQLLRVDAVFVAVFMVQAPRGGGGVWTRGNFQTTTPPRLAWILSAAKNCRRISSARDESRLEEGQANDSRHHGNDLRFRHGPSG